MTIRETSVLNNDQKLALHRLWDSEYPLQVAHDDIVELEAYLSRLEQPRHYLVQEDESELQGWACTFDRDSERWFAIIINKKVQGSGLGSRLLDVLKETETILNGWVSMDDAMKRNGEVYYSPMGFYKKHGFEILGEALMVHNSLPLQKIRWTRSKT